MFLGFTFLNYLFCGPSKPVWSNDLLYWIKPRIHGQNRLSLSNCAFMALIKSLYAKQEAAVRTEYGDTEWFEVRKDVRQGCILSPYLFSMYSEYILRKVGSEDNLGIQIGGRTINNLRYADDTTILAEDKKGMKKLLKKAKRKPDCR